MKTMNCRFCNKELTHVFADLGFSPLANSLLHKDELNTDEQFYPLKAFVCTSCFLVQLEEYENPDNIFTNYVYFSSYSESWLKHAEKYVDTITNRFKFDHNSLVIEIASNDGYLLQYFMKKGVPILGIEPAKNIAKIAQEKKIPTITKFFGTDTAKELVGQGTKADLLIGNNVLAHVPNLNDFVKGLKILLKENGIITMEFPHLLQLIRQNLFDTIYHEHFSYLSLFTVQMIFKFHGLDIFDVEEIPTHGGSLRIYAKHIENNQLSASPSIVNILRKEEEFGLRNLSTYINFISKIEKVKKDLTNFLLTVKRSGKIVVGYGAPAKANTLLNYCKIGSDLIQYTVDRSPYKQGLYLPGTHIPIMQPEKIFETKPDYILIFPWNLKGEIMEQLNNIHEWGGKFVIPIPELRIYP